MKTNFQKGIYTLSKTTGDMQKDAMIELAWKELIQAIKPKSKANVQQKSIPEIKKANHHPAVITTGEFANWEVFG